MNKITPHFWCHKTFFTYCLVPLSWVYRFIISIRKRLFQLGIKKVTYFPIPIVVVGNITVGGTGKTPLVIELANRFKTQGYKVGIVSRGYGGKVTRNPQVVLEISDPHLVGDEPLLLHKRTQCPVVVCSNRVLAVKKLIQDFSCNLVISDDGLQHYALARDLEIAVIDGVRRFDNGFCLPAGPLREPVSRLNRVNFVVINSHTPEMNNPNSFLPNNLPFLYMKLIPGKIYSIRDPKKIISLQNLQNKMIHAIAGIGNPDRFFLQLKKMGLSIIPHPFPDHHRFKASDIDFGPNEFVIMTEKDAVKCQAFVDERHWCQPVDAVVYKMEDKMMGATKDASNDFFFQPKSVH